MIMNDKKKLLWIENKRQMLNNCRIFDLYEIEKTSPLGGIGSFYLLDSPDWVTIIPLITDKSGVECFLMVEQYRHGSDQITLEFPAGMVDKGELPVNAAKRELLEETGYSAGSLIEIGEVSPNPAFMNNKIDIYIADNIELIGDQNLDNDEFIHFHLIPCTEVQKKMGTGKYSNGVMMMALAYYNRYISGTAD